ncbi:MAG: hypothetical protein IJ859_12255 [Synergistaceae bacterium]|nr:hypothetical protein [Synergistaceae bacterium]
METKKILISAVCVLLAVSSTAYTAQTATITIGFTKATPVATPVPDPEPEEVPNTHGNYVGNEEYSDSG